MAQMPRAHFHHMVFAHALPSAWNAVFHMSTNTYSLQVSDLMSLCSFSLHALMDSTPISTLLRLRGADSSDQINRTFALWLPLGLACGGHYEKE